uniref:Major facilitator superfamily (MFS) profile domain-containing protein n=1 Tax=Cyclophora tenuis TaxID=216820 RepID=A0A7S1D568_CYCTE|mmetsp:Transcript_19998/g.34160  ORF Transcript_19998/g.34160 Transcript_19998/m.34160 type:complete len:465 (+) Transcript_19998:2-1396(+)
MLSSLKWLSPKVAFALVSFSLGELGDGLNIFQGIYLVGIGWNEGSVGLALSLMGLTTLLVQTVAGDIVDKTTVDRRIFLAAASILTAVSASAILLVHDGNTDHMLIFITKIIEGIAGSFIGPCLAALTLASFGPMHFDNVMASNILWGHVGSVVAAILAGVAAYTLYPNIKYCFLVIGASALLAVIFVQHLPEGDPLMGRGFKGKVAIDEHGHLENLDSSVDDNHEPQRPVVDRSVPPPQATSYWVVFSDRKTFVLCLTGFFFHFANANVLLLLGELMGGDNEDGSPKRSAIPLIAGAIVLAQLTMALATTIGGRLTSYGIGRKPLFMAGLVTLPVRCALILAWSDAGEAYLLSTQILDGIAGGLCGLVHPYLVADITFGTGRFNVLMGLTASCFGLGATFSNFFGQLVVEHLGHMASLMGSLVISVIPVLLFGFFMPETMGHRGSYNTLQPKEPGEKQYVQMA